MPFVGIGVGIGRQRFGGGGGIFAAYAARVAADGGTTEAGACVNAVSGISLNASLLLVPSGIKSGVVYSEIPTDGNGDLTFTRNSTATRVNSDGLIESVGLNVPRLDYSGGGCPKLLLEPQRTNLLLYSDDFDDTYWSKVNLNISGTPPWNNALLSPDGTQNADILIPNNTTNAHRITRTSVGYVANASFTVSVFLKENGFRYATIALVLRNAGTFQEFASGLIDLVDKTISILGSNILFTNVEVKNLGDFQNGFTRYSLSAKTPVSGSDRLDFQINCVDSIGDAIAGDNVGGFGVWGAQLEQASYPTSYIPTTSSSVTRVADACSKTGISSLIGQTEGTIFIDVVPTDLSSSARYVSLEASAGVGSGWIGIFASGLNTFRFYGDGWDFSAGVQVRGTRYKIAMAYKNGVLTSAYINGTSVGTLTANTTGKSYASLRLASAAIGNAGCSDFFQSIIFPTALSNSDLAALTA